MWAETLPEINLARINDCREIEGRQGGLVIEAPKVSSQETGSRGLDG